MGKDNLISLDSWTPKTLTICFIFFGSTKNQSKRSIVSTSESNQLLPCLQYNRLTLKNISNRGLHLVNIFLLYKKQHIIGSHGSLNANNYPNILWWLHMKLFHPGIYTLKIYDTIFICENTWIIFRIMEYETIAFSPEYIIPLVKFSTTWILNV